MGRQLADALLGPSRVLAEKFWSGLSQVFAALVIFLVGWLIAKFIRILVTRLFKTVRIDRLAEDSGITELLGRGGITREMSDLLGIAVYWLVMLVVIFMSVNIAGVQIPESVINDLLGFIPNFVLGLLIFVLTLFIAELFDGIVRTSAANAGFDNARVLGRFTKVAIMAFGIVVALQQIGIAGAFIGNVFIIILAAFCFGCALAFALGAQHVVRDYLEGLLKRKSVQDRPAESAQGKQQAGEEKGGSQENAGSDLPRQA